MSTPQPKRTYLVPKRTGEVLANHLTACQNLQLLLHRYVPKEAIKEEKLPNGKRIPPQRSSWLQDVVLNTSRVNERLWEALYQRWLTLTKALGAETFQARLAWRMVVGLGGQSVLETDLTLDHLTGLPIIPGSALKGLTRAYAVIDASKSSAQKPEEDPQEVQQVFGSKEEASRVIFFDAMPVPPKFTSRHLHFAVDIMNPHYPEYYGDKGKGQAPPSNNQSPVPVTFLTVEGAVFEFAVAPRSGIIQQEEVTEGSVPEHETVLGWLKEAIHKYGVGGKTSAGYGAFIPAAKKESILDEEVLQQTGGQTKLRGTVQERAEDGAIIVLGDRKIRLRGFISNARSGGRKLDPPNPTPNCDVIGLIVRGEETFIELDCPPKEK
jgi:CRISPR-associated protein Cmr6